MSDLAALVAGLVVLTVGGHLIVESSSRLGARLGMTPTVIGITIVAFGTSAPDFAVTAQAAVAGDADLATGTVVGSNIANILLVLGLAIAIGGTLSVESRLVRTDVPIMIAASFALLVLSLDGRLSRIDGLVLLAGFAGFLAWSLRSNDDDAAPDPSPASDPPPPAARPAPEVVKLLVGIALLFVGARLVVAGAEGLAAALGVPELIVGLSVVALGTSAPELVTSVLAARQGQPHLAIGNAIGSNLTNILLVLGASAVLANGIPVARDILTLDLPIMLAVACACLPIIAWDHKLDRWEGIVFAGYYAAYLVFLALDATGHRAADPFALVMVAFVIPLTVLTAATITYREVRRGGVRHRPSGRP